MTTRVNDRRRSRRFTLALPVELPQGRTLTRDVSESGVYFETDDSLAPGSPIRFLMVFSQVDPEGRLRVECDGEVVRVEPHEGSTGVAALITSYRLTRDSTAGPSPPETSTDD